MPLLSSFPNYCYMVIHNSFNDFILFLYVHMSKVDNTYDPNELAVIKTKMTKLFDAGTDIEQKLYITLRQYNAFDKTKLKALFEDSLSHFNKDGTLQKKNIFADLQEIIQADGKIDNTESKALNALKQIIDQKLSV